MEHSTVHKIIFRKFLRAKILMMLVSSVHLDRHRKILELLEEYIELYSSRDDLLTTHFSENFSGYTGSGDFLVKDLGEWVKITRQDFAQVKARIHIEMLDKSLQDISDNVVVATAFFHIHLPIPNPALSSEVARLVLIFRLEGDDWKIVHSGISIPYIHHANDDEVYPLKSLQEQNSFLAALVEERTNALHKHEALYRQLTEDAFDVHWKTDSNLNITYISPSDERLRGFKAEEVIGSHVFEMFTDEGVAIVKHAMQRRVVSEQSASLVGYISFEVEHRCKDGHMIWGEVLSKPDLDANGVIIGYHGITREITQRKKAEMELKVAAIAFESQEGMLVTDASGTILRVNHAFTKITGYTAEEAIGKNPRLLKSNVHDATFYADMWQRIANRGTFEGEVLNRRKNGEVYTELLTISAVKDYEGNITHYVGAFMDISARKENEARVRFLANHDRLTELPNRELFYDRLSQAISQARRKNESVALLFLDLDGFKPVNDAYGHEAGDVVLKVVAKRLQACVRSMDTVARMGGDEFAIIITAIQNSSDAEAIAQKIIRNIAEYIQVNATTTCIIGISIGIAIYPDNGTEIDMLMNAADSAMYDSKAAGKNTYTLSTLQNQAAFNAPWINQDEVQLLGVQIIDEQHLKIVSMLNVMNEAIKHNASNERLMQLLDEIISFTDYHFKTEELLMHAYGYLAEFEHKNTHEHLLHEVKYLKSQFIKGGELVFLQKLKDWFTIHISNSDKPLADFILQQDAK